MQRSIQTPDFCQLETIDRKQTRLRRYLAGLKECGSSKDLARGKRIHSEAVQSGDESNIYLASSLISMYSKCGDLPDAREVFDRLPRRNRDVAVWTALIMGYADNGLEDRALEEFFRMDCPLNPRPFVAALKACSSLAEKEEAIQDGGKAMAIKSRSLERGREIHARACRLGFDSSDVFVGNTLVDMYAKCGSMADARRAFEKIMAPDTISWNALVLGYATNHEEAVAFEVFSRFLSTRLQPDHLSFVAVLKACSSLATKEVAAHNRLVKVFALEKGMAVHAEAGRRGLDTSLFVASSLVDMYSKCGSMVDAQRIYNKLESCNVVLWTALMLGYAENGEEDLALKLFIELRPRSCRPNALSFLAASKACTGLAVKEEIQHQQVETIKRRPVKINSLEKGMAVHSEAIRCGCCDLFLTSNLVDMYAKCASMEDAQRAFDGMERRNAVLWTVLLAGYVENGEGEKACELFAPMQRDGCHPNSASFVAALGACRDGVSIETGRAFHADICRSGVECETQVGSKLVDLYSKSGMVSKAREVFDSLPERNLVTWTSLLAGYSREGRTREVFHLFGGMLDEGLQVDRVTMLCLLTACSHAGLVERGRELLKSMSSRYGVSPGVEHCECMADLLERANEPEAAREMRKMVARKENPTIIN
ncbi:pentatricopeptide repeat-containing protein At4g18520, chloroplastic-like isoform X1 [Selaginella moellendorffii]|uniref:pentatricopeptide repeat-containing protein At4g18520, chloroplastic-like isoform X1 n=2 Tax=Selaginella moellendorffii TaxID=88036 RepID=UPI000D1CD56E|nr:pentatricopeptide repeat-containing protein At4g18520, chloroplastic-like isoform X1 [Selaginella moellendorffii]|eukprot:XP_024522676.1 pentatricopeptide repeat-containing protein At4g18520, chloroplastic-like isoform X1 [Selaginella moellendorffii]